MGKEGKGREGKGKECRMSVGFWVKESRAELSDNFCCVVWRLGL